jgi:hypothetical protein
MVLARGYQMAKRVTSILLIAIIVMGIAMSISNFVTKAYAGSMWGTTTQVTSYYWELVYYMEGRWLYDDYYCIGNASTCCVEVY